MALEAHLYFGSGKPPSKVNISFNKEGMVINAQDSNFKTVWLYRHIDFQKPPREATPGVIVVQTAPQTKLLVATKQTWDDIHKGCQKRSGGRPSLLAIFFKWFVIILVFCILLFLAVYYFRPELLNEAINWFIGRPPSDL